MALFPSAVVLVDKAFTPKAELKSPVVLASRASEPTAVFAAPLVFTVIVALPMAVLFAPDSEPSSSAVLPNATLPEPVG